MSSRKIEPFDADRAEELLHESGAAHLRARKRGSAVPVEPGPAADTIKHFRVRRDTVHLWCLDMDDHRGRWERTPFRANLDELVQTVLENFP
ncbi:MAG: hypothetical protein GY811_03400, partial [Myxococcales bacterium]|nr:hypothetical protein [Myxococcales bacterium]